MDVKDPRGSKKDWGPNAFDTGVKSVEDIIPFLTPYPADKLPPDQVLKISWIDDDDHYHAGTVQFDTGTVNVPQMDNLMGKSLIIDGDQFGLGHDDNVTVDQDPGNGNLRVNLNGQIFEYSPADVDHITVN